MGFRFRGGNFSKLLIVGRLAAVFVSVQHFNLERDGEVAHIRR